MTGPQGQIAHPVLLTRRPPLTPQVIPITDGVWTIHGLSVANSHVLDGRTGLIVVDTGNSVDEGREILRLIRTISARPIVAVIYTHSHYVHGTDALAGMEVPVIAHPRVAANMSQPAAVACERRHRAQYGRDLPSTGPDAPTSPPQFGHGPSGYRAPTRTIEGNGTALEIDGCEFIVYTDYTFDTDDCLILWCPSKRLAIHNHLTGNFPNVYSLGGGRFRDPVPWLAGLRVMRDHGPEHLLGCHGPPIGGTAECHARLTAAHDALKFVYDETVRGINEGLTPDEIVERVQLPPHLANHPALQQTYGEMSHHIRAIFTGLVGWFSGDAVDLGVVTLQFEARQIVEGFGGAAPLLARARSALHAGLAGWAAKLTRYLVRAEPSHMEARQLLADALRKIGQTTTSWSTRNFCLTQGLEWEHPNPGGHNQEDTESVGQG